MVVVVVVVVRAVKEFLFLSSLPFLSLFPYIIHVKGFTHFSHIPVYSSNKRHYYYCVPQDTYTLSHTLGRFGPEPHQKKVRHPTAGVSHILLLFSLLSPLLTLIIIPIFFFTVFHCCGWVLF